MSASQAISVGPASTIKRFFSRNTAVAIDIQAAPEKIWKMLTDAVSYPKWTSTIIEMSGSIALGGKIQLRSSLAPKRTFNLTVKEFEPYSRLVWGDAMGKRVFTLAALPNGKTRFTMSETIGGPIFPLFASLIPAFDEAFDQFAADLKKAVE